MELNFPITLKHHKDDENEIVITYEELGKLTVVVSIEGRKSISTFEGVSIDNFNRFSGHVAEYVLEFGYVLKTRNLILREFIWT